jgi:hypothetical protein
MWLIKKKKKLHEPSARDSRLESYYFGGTKPAQANILRDHILKIPNTKKGWWSNAGVEHLPSKHEAKFISQNNQKKKKDEHGATCSLFQHSGSRSRRS